MNKKFLVGFIIIIVIIVGVGIFLSQQKKQESFTNTSLSSVSPSTLSEAKPMQVVDLKDGDSYDLTAEIIKKKIGNQEIKMLGYNGSVPGPMIRVKKGSEISLNFTNKIDVPTTIHSHGVRLANAFDGVPDVTQKALQPGDSFTYKIKFPDEGMYWYHPHIREDYAQELGLYGNYLVTPEDPNYWSPVNQEWVAFLDDIYLQNGQANFADKANHTLMGRFGNVMLVNGETNYEWKAKQGEVVRLYLTNAANTRPFNVKIPGVKMKLVGGDSGKYEQEEWKDAVLLGPSERAIVEVLFEKTGEYTLEHETPQKVYPLARITVSETKADISYTNEFNTLRENNDVIQSIDPFREYFNRTPDKSIRLSINMKSSDGMGMSGSGTHNMHGGTMMKNSEMGMGEVQKIEWEDDMAMMNSNSTVDTLTWQIIDEETKKVNEDIDWKFRVGDKVKVKIFNDSKSMHPMQHPIHFHGQRFLVLSTNGVQNNNLVWKDTALIQTGDTVEILIDMSNPGEWMAHCHISEHLEAGMMFGFTVK